MRKMILCASLALAATAIAVPATASANWTHNHAHIPAGTNPTVHGEGNLAFASGIGGVSCTQVTLTAQLTGGTTTAHINELTPGVASCKGTGGLGSCTITSVTADGFPWIGHVTGTAVTGTKGIITGKMSGLFCPPELILETTSQHHLLIQPDETGTVGGHKTITSLTLGGQMTIRNPTNSITITGTPSGNVTATAPDSHTYGFT